MTREQLWAQYAAAALSGMLANEYSQSSQQAMVVDADTAANYADAMLAEHLSRFPQDQQEAKKADADDWIKWEGGECPAPGAGVDVKFRVGLCYYGAPSSHYDWDHHSDPADIVAYRLSR